MEQERLEQILEIKKRLTRLVFQERGLNLSQLQKMIESTPGLYTVSYNTLARLFSEQQTAADLCAVIAVCRCLDLDISYVLSPPSPKATDPDQPKYQVSFPVLQDSRYLGFFHGFLFTPNPERDELIRFELELKKLPHTTTATMTYHGRPVNVDLQETPDLRILRGTPYLDELHSNIHIELTNENGDYYFLYFTYQRLRSHDLYFRRGIAITPSSLSGNAPIVQNFVLFAREVSDSKLPYIRGLLADVSPTFYIGKDTMESLRSQHPVVNDFYNSFLHILEHDVIDVYPINEHVILSTNQSNMTRRDVTSALLLLKGASIATSRQVYEDPGAYGIFSKEYLQQP